MFGLTKTLVAGLGIFSAFVTMMSLQLTAQHAAPPLAATPRIVETDLKGSDPRRFTDCELRATKIKQLACSAGAAAEAAAFDSPAYYFQALAAVEAANLVQATLSSARYAYMVSISQHRPPASAEKLAIEGAGICGNHVEAFLAIMSELGIKARPIQFYYTDQAGVRQSHIAAEVSYAGRWNYFDVTWNAVFPAAEPAEPLQFRSYTEVLASKDPVPLTDNVNAWTMSVRLQGLDPFEYLKARPLSVTAGGVGTVNVPAPTYGTYIEDLHDLPNYVGDNLEDGQHQGIDYWVNLKGTWRVTVHIAATAGCADADGDRLVIGGRKLPMDNHQASADIDGPIQISIETKKDLCYAVLENLEFRSLNSNVPGDAIVTGSIK